MEGVLAGLVVLDVVEPEPDPEPDPEPEPEPAAYGQGLHSSYENPHVFPRRHVQPKPTSGSRGQAWIPVHELLPEPEPEPDPDPEPEPDGCITRMVVRVGVPSESICHDRMGCLSRGPCDLPLSPCHTW